MFCGVEREAGNVIRVDCVAHKTTSGMGIKSNHEEEGKVVSVPERLEALVADLVVRRGVHYEHDKKHEMTSDATGLRVMNLESCLFTDF
jgi:hypothetical protein